MVPSFVLMCAQVVRAAGDAYITAATKIPRLSPAGGAQLAADAEYLANVMSALAVAPPAALAAAAALGGAPDDAVAAAAAAGGGGGGGPHDAQVRVCAWV